MANVAFSEKTVYLLEKAIDPLPEMHYLGKSNNRTFRRIWEIEPVRFPRIGESSINDTFCGQRQPRLGTTNDQAGFFF
jgi:hypothetical protein